MRTAINQWNKKLLKDKRKETAGGLNIIHCTNNNPTVQLQHLCFLWLTQETQTPHHVGSSLMAEMIIGSIFSSYKCFHAKRFNLPRFLIMFINNSEMPQITSRSSLHYCPMNEACVIVCTQEKYVSQLLASRQQLSVVQGIVAVDRNSRADHHYNGLILYQPRFQLLTLCQNSARLMRDMGGGSLCAELQVCVGLHGTIRLHFDQSPPIMSLCS